MRIEPYSIGSYLHVVKRGARGMNITRSKSDMWHFLRLLYFMNDEFVDWEWKRKTRSSNLFERPPGWPEKKPLVYILCYTFMPNHIHLLLKEIQEGGVSLFLKKLGQSMTEHMNRKYGEKGSLFQGSYRSKTINSNEYLERVAAYIMIKNTLELYPKHGLTNARKNFNDAWEWAAEYPFSSFADFSGHRAVSPILKKDLLEKIFPDPQSFKKHAKNVLQRDVWASEQFE